MGINGGRSRRGEEETGNYQDYHISPTIHHWEIGKMHERGRASSLMDYPEST